MAPYFSQQNPAVRIVADTVWAHGIRAGLMAVVATKVLAAAGLWSGVMNTWTSSVEPALLAAGDAVLPAAASQWLHDEAGSEFGRDRLMFTVGSVALHEVLYYGINSFFWLCDTGHLRILDTFKLPRTPAQAVPDWLIKRTIREALMGHLIIQPLFAFLGWSVFVSRGSKVAPQDLPAFGTAFWQFFVCSVFLEFAFYWTHRWVHENKTLYKMVHKQHHTYSGTIGFAAEYAHPFEQVVSNVGPTIAMPLILGMHMGCWWLWLTYRLVETYVTHSGYAMPFFLGDETKYHDFHHSANRGSYGGGPFWDWLCGTNEPWVQACEKAEREGLLNAASHED